MKGNLRKKPDQLHCCTKFSCFMLGALLSVLSVAVITMVTTWIIIDREPIFKSEHKKPLDISGYGDSEVTNIIY